jgi:acetyl esterase/lipase
MELAASPQPFRPVRRIGSMHFPRWFFSLLSVFPLFGCSGADLVNWVTPRGGYSLERGLAYGEGPRRILDVYRPEEIRPGSPIVVFFYGGNWDSGRRADYLFVGQAFASRGYLTVIPDYRVFPETTFPGFVEDGAQAVAWVNQNRNRLGAGARPIVLVGHSAGAQIALLLTLDRHYLQDAGAPVCRTIAATVGLSGPYDFLPLKEERYKRIFPEATRPSSQPIAFVAKSEPPALLLVGDADKTVDPGNTARLAARMAERGAPVDTKVYEGIGHVGMVSAFARPLRGRASVLDDIDAYLRRLDGATAPFC